VAFLDFFRKQKPSKPLSEIGATGLDRPRNFGTIEEEFALNLRGRNAFRVYREMRDNDSVIGAVMYAIEMMMRGVEWRIEGATETGEDETNRQFVESCIDDMSHTWENFLSEVVTMLTFGFSTFETVYKIRGGDSPDPKRRSKFTDGKYGWRKFAPRAQDAISDWQFDEDGGIQGIWQLAPPDYQRVFIPIEKLLLFRTTSVKNNPEGRSVLRNAYRGWYFKKRIETYEAIGVERDLAGYPVVKIPGEIIKAGGADYESWKSFVRDIRRDDQEGAVLPSDRDEHNNALYEFELLSTRGSRQFNTTEIINRYDQRIAMTVLADFVLLGHEKVGSFALASSKTNLFSVALQAFMNEIRSIINRIAIPRLFMLNGMQAKELPTLEFGDIEAPDLTDLGEYIGKLSGAGADLFPDLDLENSLRRRASLPEKSEELQQEQQDTKERLRPKFPPANEDEDEGDDDKDVEDEE